jgi:sortase A
VTSYPRSLPGVIRPLASTKGARDSRSPTALARSIQAVGEILISVGALFVLFAAYQLWWTNFLAAGATDQARTQAEQIVDRQDSTEWAQGAPPIGTPFALVYIPRLSPRVWQTPLIQGVEKPQLNRGIGHYPQTAMPGQVGNVGLAGHRATHGEPFARIDKLQQGDKVYIETGQAWYTYVLQRDKIVDPHEIWVINPQPFPQAPLASTKLITLTTCNPRWASYTRWIWWGVQVDARPHTDGPPPGMGKM